MECFFSYTNIKALLVRYYMEYKELAKAMLACDVLERIVFFIAFGVGLGKAVHEIAGVSYMTFLAPGIAAGSGIFVMAAATTYGAHNRYSSGGIWQSWLATPIRLQDLLMAEIIFPSFRAMPSLLILYIVAYFFGAIPSITGAIISIPILFLVNLVYGAITLLMAGYLGRMLYFKYIQSLWVMPMYLFSGVFYNIEEAPVWMQGLAQIFPLTHVLEVVRPLVLGLPVDWVDALVRFVVLIVIFVVAFYLTLKEFKKRLFN